ncbi:F protein [Erinnyis ello granulovirus]|uniref:Envelope fusion protein n=1 Tax=Erinnyis ello granulovirus TaxID=307444 RepID=A0A097DAL7_9BBAC|nr:F protein [Erinnyis ello granulovirus]AIS92028.1 F protein [Erinnyis ello granulovirus]ARX71367.1 envelope fusion protein [Erinnyis ello granulovirus]ARX71497.1 envelope fusion protein [Erinnyis ello granulovirus]ARX71627.1 envelope fusion protein [Erinnyis ello granulovirus]ARX71757.1 envelope fusion protein [Erinnyis ello granulovirus]
MCSIITVLTTLLITHTQFVYTQENNILVTPINTTGFYYEFYSNLGFVVNTWSFILNVKYNLLLDRVTLLKNMSDSIHLSISKNNYTVNCSTSLQNNALQKIEFIINTKIPNLFDTYNSIEYLLAHKRLAKKNRVKRNLFGGAFNFVGRIDKYLFGVMDDNDAALLYELANHTNNTDFHIKTLTKETIRLSDSVQSLENNIHTLYHCNQVDYVISSLENNLDEIEGVYNKIITGIQTTLYSGKLSSLIVKPHVILDEMKNVDSNAWDKETEWVVQPNHEQMHTVMRLIQCNVFINPENELMFVIQVPRMDKTKFLLYKPVSIPSCEHGTCKFLVPQSRYIGFENHNNAKHYVRLDDTNTCSNFDNLTLCYNSMTSKKIEYSFNCDVRLFKGLDYKKCAVHASQFQNEIFYSLNNVNRWLYMVHEKPVVAHINCRSAGFNDKITLFGTGVLTLLNYCKVRTSRTVLMSKHINNYETEKFTSVQFNFTQFVLPFNYTATISNYIVKSLDYSVLSSVSHNLKKLLTQEEADKLVNVMSPDDNSNANWYSNLFGNWWWEIKFICYIVCILMVALLVIKTKHMCCRPDDRVVPLKMFYH